MEAKHLIIGDWVYNSKNEICKVCAISQIFESNITLDNYSKPNDGTFEYAFEVNPIPCTDEIFKLNKNIFKYDEDYGGYLVKSTDFLISYDENTDDFDIYVCNDSVLGNDYIYLKTIKYVHELQHFIFDNVNSENKIIVK